MTLTFWAGEVTNEEIVRTRLTKAGASPSFVDAVLMWARANPGRGCTVDVVLATVTPIPSEGD
jgi:hypothetical protein